MNTKLLMYTSAIFLGIIGLLFSFLPQETANYLNIETNIITVLFLQILSAMYLGFGILNWMAKGSIIGGIYNKPIAIGNFMHFGVGGIALVKILFKIQEHAQILVSMTVIYVIFACCFAYVFMNNPKMNNNSK